MNVYTLFGSVKYDPYDDHVVGVFSTMEKAVQRAQIIMCQDEYEHFRIMQHELDSDAPGELVKTLGVGGMYHVQVTHQDRILPVTVLVRSEQDVVAQAKQWVVNHYAAQGVRVFKKHMQVSIVYSDDAPVLLHA
jgi:hypothetical protein